VRRIPALSPHRAQLYSKAPEYGTLQTLRAIRPSGFEIVLTLAAGFS